MSSLNNYNFYKYVTYSIKLPGFFILFFNNLDVLISVGVFENDFRSCCLLYPGDQVMKDNCQIQIM